MAPQSSWTKYEVGLRSLGALLGDTYLRGCYKNTLREGADALVQQARDVGVAKLAEKPRLAHDELEGAALDISALDDAG